MDLDQPVDPDVDADSQSTLLGVVQPPEPTVPSYDEAIRTALATVQADLVRLRAQRRDDDREGLAEIARMKRDLIARRKATNSDIAELVAEQKRIAALVRVLDKQ